MIARSWGNHKRLTVKETLHSVQLDDRYQIEVAIAWASCMSDMSGEG